MKTGDSLTTNGFCMIILKTEEMLHLSSSINNKKKNIIIKIQAELIAINSMWPCLHMLLVYWNLSTMFLHMNRQAAPEHLLCTDFPGNYATPEHCVMTEPLPGTHYHCIRYGASYFSEHWTNRYWLCCDKSLQWERERNVPLCLIASYFMPGYNLVLISDILGCTLS